jgi:hypothetical protein
MSHDLEQRLTERLAEGLDRPTATDLVARLVEVGTVPAVLALLGELEEISTKAFRAAIEALPELNRRGGLQAVVTWLDLGVALAGSSGATALRYFRESPLILGLFETVSAREQALRLALELADRDANVALEFIKTAPELLAALPPDHLPAWVEAGLDLASVDHVLGLEFFRQGPVIAAAIPLGQVRAWTGFGMKLITLNSLGKTDYLGTLEFFRTSPAIFGDIEGASVRATVIELGSTLADRDPQTAILFLADSPALLRALPSEAWRLKVLRYGLLIAEREAETALAYLRRCPEVVALVGPSTPIPPSPSGPVAPGTRCSLLQGVNATNATGQGEGEGGDDKFEGWFKGGMEVLAYSPEGARAYFALETHKALASLEQAMSGVPLRQIARSLKLFAQGLCGVDVAIRAIVDLSAPGQPESGRAEPLKQSARARVSADGRTIALPALLRRYATREENIRLYRVMTAHEAGHLEFGTYSLPVERLVDLTEAVWRRYGRAQTDDRAPASQSLAELFRLYPQPALIRDLWTVLEDARVEYRLREEYPGLKQDLARLAREAVTTRSLRQGLSVRELVVDALLLLSTAEPGTVRVPDSIRDLVNRAWALFQTILTPSATAEEVVRVADRVYLLLEEAVTSAEHGAEDEREPASGAEQGAGPRASEEMSGEYRPVTNWAYRGVMEADQVRDRRGGGPDREQRSEGPDHALGGASEEQSVGFGGSGVSSSRNKLRGQQSGEVLVPGGSPGSVVEQWLMVGDPPLTPYPASLTSQERAFLYDEWDGTIQDYRSGWCRVIERVMAEGSAEFAEATLAAHGPAVRLLRRYFESLRPPGLRLVRGRMDGEEIDLDAAIRRTADLAAGAEASDRIFVRRERRERVVAAAILVDLSGSTSRRIDAQGQEPRESVRQVIEIEKEGLILLGEALAAIGDQFAVYGYSGQGRQRVDFVVLKDFDEPADRRLGQRLGSILPLHQNRDGAAIRHATRKLLARNVRHRLLLLISDGRPLDDGYADEYSLEDTKMALREARTKGVDPFCITVDRSADDYVRRMYGDVRFLVIDHIGALPERLPRVYHRLTA